MATKPLQPSTTDARTSWLGRLAREFWAQSSDERARQLDTMSSIEYVWLTEHRPKKLHIPP